MLLSDALIADGLGRARLFANFPSFSTIFKVTVSVVAAFGGNFWYNLVGLLPLSNLEASARLLLPLVAN